MQRLPISVSMNIVTKNGDQVIHLSIKDDGVGLDMDNINPGLGLLGIRERVEMLDGVIDISDSNNNGLTIEIDIPLKE